ncbi:MAG: phosphoglycerate dehydrogenase [Dehalococcoidia bacterium]|nr:phosphoglycerate dehydrogenase [Dehalococcoidia bacterium]
MKVLIADPIAQEGIEALRAHAEVDVRLGLSRDELIAAIGDYEAIVVRSETKVSAEVIEAGRKLQVIGRAGVGVDNIDVEVATRKGIVVVNAPTGNIVSAAEHTIALMLAMARHIPQANALLRSGVWRRHDFMGIEIRNKILGIIGLGNVGSEVARRAKGLEMRLIAHDPFVSVEYARNLGVELVSLEEILKESDFITLHTPLTGTTKGLIGAKELAMVKPTVRIINCARGGIIDEEALFKAVEGGRVAGAAIDVFAEEPARESILFKSDRILVTPHLAASTAEAQATIALDVAEQIIAVLQGQPARYAVNTPLISPETLSFVAPFLGVAQQVGRLLCQLAEGQMSTISIKYEGEIANYDTAALKAAIIGGLLEAISEERVNLVNANIIAQRRGLKITEHKDPICENYGNLITLEVTTSAGVTTVAGTVMRGEPHIVRVNSYWIDVVPRGGYFLFSDHRDRPGFIGTVGTILGNVDINISSMQLGRLEPRGAALLVLELDEPIGEEQRLELLAIPDVYTIKLVKL